MFTHVVPFEAAEPANEVAVDAVAVGLVSQAYVYLFLVVDAQPTALDPKANIPIVLLPAAAPKREATVAAVAVGLVLQAYIYLFLVVIGPQKPFPRANIPLVEFPAAYPR